MMQRIRKMTKQAFREIGMHDVGTSVMNMIRGAK